MRSLITAGGDIRISDRSSINMESVTVDSNKSSILGSGYDSFIWGPIDMVTRDTGATLDLSQLDFSMVEAGGRPGKSSGNSSGKSRNDW
ncbi:hypothetical protein Tco_0798162 [Tanacetum coccineum]